MDKVFRRRDWYLLWIGRILMALEGVFRASIEAEFWDRCTALEPLVTALREAHSHWTAVEHRRPLQGLGLGHEGIWGQKMGVRRRERRRLR